MREVTCTHTDDGTECRECFKEHLRSVRIAPGATPSRVQARRRGTAPTDREAKNGWERGEPTDDRGMPYLDEHGVRVNTKKLAETRHRYRKHEKINVTS